MQTECIAGQLEFEGFDGRSVVAAFDAGAVTSDAGAVLLRETDRAIRLIERVAACFSDGRDPGQLIHALPTLVGQRIVAIALGYEDVNDHDTLRRDPVLALFSDQLQPKRKDCAPLAGKSTMNRLEHAPGDGCSRYHKIGCDREALQEVFVDVFLDAHGKAPREIVLDLDATDDPLHGHQEGRFFASSTSQVELAGFWICQGRVFRVVRGRQRHPFVRPGRPSLRPNLPSGRLPRAAAVKDGRLATAAAARERP